MQLRKMMGGLALGLLALLNASMAHAQCPTTGMSAPSINLNLSGNCTVNGSLTATNGGVSVTVTGGTLTVTGQVSSTSGQTVYLSADGGVSLATVSSAGTMTAVSSGGNVTVSGTVTSTGNAYFDGVTTTIASVTSSGGQVSVNTQNTGAVTVNGSITSGSDTLMYAHGGITVTSTINSSGEISVIGDSGIVSIGGTATSQHGAIFFAGKDLSLQAVNNQSTGYYDVRLFANQNGTGSDTFKIGSAGGPNGVLSVNNTNDVGGRTIYIADGGTGGINYNGTSLLQVSGSAGPSGIITLNTNQPVTLAGTLVVDGSTGQNSGVINIFGSSVTANGATLSSSTSQNIGYINLTTNAINVASGLTITINGNGPAPNYVDLGIGPVGSYSVTSAPTNLSQPVTYSQYTTSTNPLAITGAGALTINSAGNLNGIKIYGYPFTLTPATTTITVSGSQNQVYLSGTNGGSSGNTITLAGTIAIHANNTASGQTANTIDLYGTNITGPTKNVLLDASGTTGGSGSNINLALGSGNATFAGSGVAFTLKASGSSTGGNGGNIQVFGTNFTVSNTNGVLAAGGGTTGNGGTIAFNGSALTFTQSNAQLNANASSATGNGGTITINTGSVTFAGTTSAITANGGKTTSGNGGTINITTYSALDIGSGASGNIALTAEAPKSGSGGTINITNPATLTVAGANLLVTANGTGIFNGGTINLSNIGQLTVTGTLSANGAGTGEGGNITLAQTGTNAMTLDSSTITANAGTTGPANGGNITITSTNSGITTSASTLDANGVGNGNGGNLTLKGNTATDLSQTTISAIAGTSGSGEGGKVIVALASSGATNTPLNVNAQIKVNGGSNLSTSNSDGSISLNNVTCGQWKAGSGTGSTTWPYTYWDCVTPTTGATASPLATSAASLESLLKTQLGSTKTPSNPSIQIYAATAIDSYLNYLCLTVSQPTGVYGISTDSIRVSFAFTTVYTASGSQAATVAYPPASAGSSTIMQAALTHELGHELDYIWGNLSTVLPFSSKNGQQSTDVKTDLTQLLNSGACANAFTSASCTANATQWAGLTNLQIYSTGNPSAMPPIPGLGYSTDPIELFAIVFEHLESVNHGLYAAPPDLERVVATQFPTMSSYIQGLINKPPTPVN